MSQREVIHAHGQTGSNHISTEALAAIGLILSADGLSGVRMRMRSCEDVVTLDASQQEMTPCLART
jgi:hypothetical protein